MTEEQQEFWMSFIREDKTYTKYYDEFVVLLGTGMHVGEFCGLTKGDLDFVNRKIRVDHQLVRGGAENITLRKPRRNVTAVLSL